MPELIHEGRVYSAVPPLHRIELSNPKKGMDKYVYTYSDVELQRKLAELSRKNVRRRVTEPLTRYWMKRALPVHHGFPTFQAARSSASSLPGSGVSSPSGCAGCQLPNCARRLAVLNQTRPEPCQWIPTMVKLAGASRVADARAAASGTSRVTTRIVE